MYKIYIKNLKIKYNNFTNFEKISYLPFLNNSIPYYTKQEIINMGLNFKLIKTQHNIDNNTLFNLYKQIIKNDFSSLLILKNIQYINKNKVNDLVKFYTFHGSYYMNTYLRNNINIMKDNFLEKLITKLWNICLKAPKNKITKICL